MTHFERFLNGYAVLGIVFVLVVFFTLISKMLGSVWLLVAFGSAPIAYLIGGLLDDEI